MTLVVGMRCAASIVLGAEQEEVAGFSSKRNVHKLKLHHGGEWALGFGGAGEGAIIDGAERRLTDWLATRDNFTVNELSDAVEDTLAAVYTKFIDPDPKSEGISLVIGASCADGLVLIKTQKRVAQILDDYACAGYGSDVASYLLDRLYDADDKWIDALKIAAFAIYEVKNSTQYCGGDSDFVVLQRPPDPRWRELGDYFSVNVENEIQGLIRDLRPELIRDGWRPELSDGYSDEFSPEGRDDLHEFENLDLETTKKRFAEIERLRSLDT